LFDQPNSYIGNAYIAWARFRPVEVMRQQLREKFNQMMMELSSTDQKAEVYTKIITTLINLGAKVHNDINTINYNAHREWAITVLKRNDLDSIINEINSQIDSEQFLASTPSK
jgi:predicted hydrocarbon binding protein